MAVIINDEIIEQVKDSSDIVEIISEYIQLKKSGSNYMGLCPFHNEKTPSFSVNESRQFYHCFGCGEGGDSIEFIMKQENLDFIEAVKYLADRYNIQLEDREIDTELVKEKKNFYDMNRDAARFFYSNLRKNKGVIKYLNNRHISGKIINQFGLGFALDSWDALYNHLIDKDYTEEDMEKNGLIVKRNDGSGYYDRFRNRVIFPIIDTRSRVIGFGGRVMDDSMPKYLNSKDSLVFNKGNNLYGLNLVSKHSNRDKIILVEGYMDVIALYAAGIDYSVASLGTSLTKRQAQLLKRYGKEVYICYDSDQAGIRATHRAIDVLVEEQVKPRIISLPDGKDPDDFINEKGILGFDKKIKESYNYIDYKIKDAKIGYDLDEVEDKIEFTMKVAQIIKTLESPIMKDVYIKKISEDTDISEKAIKKEISGIEEKKSYTKDYNEYDNYSYPEYDDNYNNYDIPYDDGNSFSFPGDDQVIQFKREEDTPKDKNENTLGVLKAEANLIKIVLDDKDHFYMMKSRLSKEEFTDRYRNIYEIINNAYEREDILDFNRLKNDSMMDETEKELLKSLINSDFQYEATNVENVILDLIRTIKYNNINKKRRKVLKDIEDIEKLEEKASDDIDYLRRLVIELTDLNNQLRLIKDE